MALRDLRPELKERKSALREERVKLQVRLREIDTEESALDSLIAGEDRRFGVEPEPEPEPELGPRVGPESPRRLRNLFENLRSPPASSVVEAYATSPMRRAVLTELADGKPHSHDEITKAIEEKGTGAAKGGSLGRSVQGTLLSLRYQKVVQAVGDGVWQLAQ